jgi:hypothetical protein
LQLESVTYPSSTVSPHLLHFLYFLCPFPSIRECCQFLFYNCVCMADNTFYTLAALHNHILFYCYIHLPGISYTLNDLHAHHHACCCTGTSPLIIMLFYKYILLYEQLLQVFICCMVSAVIIIAFIVEAMCSSRRIAYLTST